MQNKDCIISKIEDKYLKTGKITRDDTLLIGLSGGPDSMCLLDIFVRLKSLYNYNIVAIHINHGIRGDEALRDLNFTKNYCKSMGVDFIEKTVDAVSYSKKNNLTLEEAARKLRYKEFDKAWKELSIKVKVGNVYLLIAHHMKDQVETIFHNMVRGTGIAGLSGIKEENGYIKRPLLDISKEEIDTYIKKYDIPFVYDSTNDDINYTRNFIRKDVLAHIDKLNDKAYEHIAEVGKDAREIDEYLEMLCTYLLKKMVVEKNAKSIVLSLMLFRNTSHIIQVYIVRKVLATLVSTLKDFTRKHIEDIIALSMKEKGGHIDLPYNITFDKKQKNIIFSHNDDNISMKRKKKK